ncbi:MAG: hypothetical protein ABIG44_12025 [Planctomycetota bacterium]
MGRLPVHDNDHTMDTLVESTIQALNRHVELCERAVTYPGRPRERMVALGEADELFYRLHPHHYRALQVVRVASQLGKTTNPRRDMLRRCESRTVALLTTVIQDALHAGDLKLTGSHQAAELAFSIWALVFGTRALMNTAVASVKLDIADGYQVAYDTAGLLFDALGWRPLAHEWDYQRTRQQIRQELFPDEWRQACAA